jgi:hypothetical protein
MSGDLNFRINRTWSWILIAALVTLVIAIWAPFRETARAATPAYIFPEDNPNYVHSIVDSATKPSPFPDRPAHYSR